MKIEDIQTEIVEEFRLFDDWEQRYEHLISLGKKLEPFPEESRDEEHIIKGCQSRVWLHSDMKEGRLQLLADSDSILTKGMIALMVRVFSDQPAEDILQAEIGFIDEIGLREHLSPTRANGLVSMLGEIKKRAAVGAVGSARS